MNFELSTTQFSGWADKLVEIALNYGPPLLLAILMLFIGLKVIKKLQKLTVKALEVAGISESLVPFLASVVGVGLKILLFLAVAGVVGIDLSLIHI